MSNIYNLQQVSLNSRIVAVEGTFDHIDANNINIGNQNIVNLTVTEINATDPLVGICINDRILIEEIDEKNLNFGVGFPNKIRVNIIEEFTGLNSVDFPTNIKTDFIQGSTSTDVQIDDIEADILRIQSGNNKIRIQRPTALTLTEEYGEYNFNFLTSILVGGPWVEPNLIGITNSGVQPYLPDNAGLFRLTVNEDGIYSFSIVIQSVDALASGDHYAIKMRKFSGEVLSLNSGIVGTETTATDYHLHGSFCSKLLTSDVILFEMRTIAGPSVSKNFTSKLYLTRIK